MSTDPVAARHLDRHAWVDGRLVRALGPVLAVEDRGFQLGDGVFETIRVHGARPLELGLHAERLAASCRALEIPLADGMEERVRRAIAELIAADGLDDPDDELSVRVTVTRGPVEGRGLLPPLEARPTIAVQAWRVAPVGREVLERGLHVSIASVRRDPQNPLATVKTTSRAEFVFARLEARRRGADDAIFLTTDGRLAEATSASLFLVRAGLLSTPSLDCGILVGTTREWILRWADRVGLRRREALLSPDDLFAADEAFLASSVAGVVPVTRVDGRPVGDGRPGPWTMRAREDREAFARSGEG